MPNHLHLDYATIKSMSNGGSCVTRPSCFYSGWACTVLVCTKIPRLSQRKSSQLGRVHWCPDGYNCPCLHSGIVRERICCILLHMHWHFGFNGLWSIQMSFMRWKRAIVAGTHYMLTVVVCMVRNLFVLSSQPSSKYIRRSFQAPPRFGPGRCFMPVPREKRVKHHM